MTGEAPVPVEYLIGHVQEALGSDERVGEWDLGIVVDGATVTVTGVVATPARKAAVAAVARESLAGLGGRYQVVDVTQVMAAGAPAGEEEIT